MTNFFEWLMTLRDGFIYFAICLSIPSLLLYMTEIGVILCHKQFHNSFYALFVTRAIADLLYVLDSFACYRLPTLFADLLLPFYEKLPKAVLTSFYVFSTGTYQANSLATAFILLNRLTAIALPIQHQMLWRKLLPLSIAVAYGIPICTCYCIYQMDTVLYVGNDSQNGNATIFFAVEVDKEAPYTTYYANLQTSTSIIFLILSALLNCYTIFVYKSQRKNIVNQQDKTRKIEQRLLIYAIATLFGHILIACLMIAFTLAGTDLLLLNALNSQYPWVMDTGTVVLASWLLPWASSNFRKKLFELVVPKFLQSADRNQNIHFKSTTIVVKPANQIG